MKPTVFTSATLGLILAMAATGAIAQEQGPGRGAPGAMLIERFDADGDGAVTQAEIDAYRGARFAEADTDGDGFLTAAEMTAFAQAQREVRQQERRTAMATALVDRLDTDDDGRLSAEEAAQGTRMLPFDRIDADSDGAITADELRQARADRQDGGRRGWGHGDKGRHERGHDRGERRGENRGGMPWWLQ